MQHGDQRGEVQADAFRPPGDRSGERHRGWAVPIFGAVVLGEVDDVETRTVGDLHEVDGTGIQSARRQRRTRGTHVEADGEADGHTVIAFLAGTGSVSFERDIGAGEPTACGDRRRRCQPKSSADEALDGRAEVDEGRRVLEFALDDRGPARLIVANGRVRVAGLAALVTATHEHLAPSGILHLFDE